MKRANGKVDPARLRRLHARRMHDGKIAAALGVARSTVAWWRYRLGLRAWPQPVVSRPAVRARHSSQARRLSPDAKAWAERLIAVGEMKDPAIAAAIGATAEQVRHLRVRAGIKREPGRPRVASPVDPRSRRPW